MSAGVILFGLFMFFLGMWIGGWGGVVGGFGFACMIIVLIITATRFVVPLWTMLKRRTPIRRVSKKHAAELRVYSGLRAKFLAERPYCEARLCLGSLATEVHHTAKRGKNLNNVETWLPVCRPCHTYIEEHKSWARANGLLE